MLFRVLIALHLLVWLINLRLFPFLGAVNQLQKLLLFAGGLAFVLSRKTDRAALICIGAIIGVTLFTAFLSSFPALSFLRYFQSLFSLVSILLPLAAFASREDQIFVLRWIAWAPIACVGIGALYQVAGIWTLFATDFLGVTRLQGSSIPAGMGTIGYVGTIAAMLASAAFDRRYLAVAAINIIILALSAARMAFAMAIIPSLVIFYAAYARSFGRFYFYSLALAVVAAVGFVLVGDRIMDRFASDSSSGRDLIWEALNLVVEQYPWFGIGLGHQITVIPEEVIEKAVTIAAHNEYLRLTLETGYVGAALIFGLLAAIFIIRMIRFPDCRNLAYVSIVASFFVYCMTDNVLSSSLDFFALFMAGFFAAPSATRGSAKRTNGTLRRGINGIVPPPTGGLAFLESSH